MLHVALYQPEIPPNVGNAARQCVGMQAHLHLIGPHPLDLSDKAVRRAGLDYWPHLTLTEHPSPDAFLGWLGRREPWLVTKRGTIRFDQAPYADGDILLFGNERKGLPPDWLNRWPTRQIVIPQPGPVRSYNLTNCVAIVLATAVVRTGREECP